MVQRLLAIACLGVGVSYVWQNQISVAAIWINMAGLILHIAILSSRLDNFAEWLDALGKLNDIALKRIDKITLKKIEEENGCR